MHTPIRQDCASACRKYLKQKPPSGLSWHGSIKLDDKLSAGIADPFPVTMHSCTMNVSKQSLVDVYSHEYKVVNKTCTETNTSCRTLDCVSRQLMWLHYACNDQLYQPIWHLLRCCHAPYVPSHCAWLLTMHGTLRPFLHCTHCVTCATRMRRAPHTASIIVSLGRRCCMVLQTDGYVSASAEA